MGTVTIYRINETDRTIDIAQSVSEDNESVRAAILNAKTFTFDEILRQHITFCGSGTAVENCRSRFSSPRKCGFCGKMFLGGKDEVCCRSEYDEFCQTKEERKAHMNSLKRRLIRNGLPSHELYETGERFEAEIKTVAERIMERCGK